MRAPCPILHISAFWTAFFTRLGMDVSLGPTLVAIIYSVLWVAIPWICTSALKERTDARVTQGHKEVCLGYSTWNVHSKGSLPLNIFASFLPNLNHHTSGFASELLSLNKRPKLLCFSNFFTYLYLVVMDAVYYLAECLYSSSVFIYVRFVCLGLDCKFKDKVESSNSSVVLS